MAAERKRPWYLVLALFGAMVLGTMGSCDGWTSVARYRGTMDPLAAQAVSDAADRTAIESRATAYIHMLDATRSKGWPLAVATLLLGTAMMLFAMRALSGSSGARAALIQLAVAQAGLSGLTFWLMRDVSDAELQLRAAWVVADVRVRDPDRAQVEDRLPGGVMLRLMNPVALALSTLGSAFVVVALTRRRAREFFDASSAAFQER